MAKHEFLHIVSSNGSAYFIRTRAIINAYLSEKGEVSLEMVNSSDPFHFEGYTAERLWEWLLTQTTTAYRIVENS